MDMPNPIGQPLRAVDYDRYDLIFFSNGPESYTIGTDTIRDNLLRSNVYLLAQSHVTVDHPLRSKIIWVPVSIMFPHSRSMSFNFFYPQAYYFSQNKNRQRSKNIVCINGENRSWRHYLIEQLHIHDPSLPIISNLGNSIRDTDHAYFESAADQQFREFLETRYRGQIDSTINTLYNTVYWDSSVPVGVSGQYGTVLPGYFAMPEYFEYRCVIFPESSWVNDDLNLTEKIIKCLLYGSIPWPVGGANVNAQYRDLGIYTAWNLLPSQLQLYDSIHDHQTRYKKLAEAVTWANQHPEIFVGSQYENYIKQNFENIVKFAPALDSIVYLDKIINEHSR